MSRSVLLAAASLLALAWPARAQQLARNDINQMSIEQLADVKITSVSKAAEPLSDAPAAVYVISHDDAIRSGATSLPEILRLAPNLEVMQTSPSNYVITARGFNGNAADQNFSDKLLVLIDGRSVYSPLYSGVYWDMQDVLPENIERIEVISGPAADVVGRQRRQWRDQHRHPQGRRHPGRISGPGRGRRGEQRGASIWRPLSR